MEKLKKKANEILENASLGGRYMLTIEEAMAIMRAFRWMYNRS